ncbi:hypothetical protein HPP92_004469 [Vanilla planifolia]|uniref:UspA domain-containing protein n=1 Tax=Vanilla planifolia TaxID=51239 RepID=A0A835RJI9_VANPL|nr:hypothetical protein HPP92_004469 [Vanilla planifolia]
MEKLSVEAFQTVMAKTVARIVEGDPGKVICREANRLKPVAVVMGTRGRSIIQRQLDDEEDVASYALSQAMAVSGLTPPGSDMDELLFRRRLR